MLNQRNITFSEKINFIYEKFYNLESILFVTRDNCLNMEICSNYYNLYPKDRKYLSQERNNYINMLNIALDNVSLMKQEFESIEEDLEQNSNNCC